MKSIFLFQILVFILLDAIAQTPTVYQKGMTAEKNLNALMSLAPYTDGAVGFDTRYQGIKGSPRLFDTLLTSFLRVKGQDYYIQVAADLDIAGSSVIFNHPKSGRLTAIPVDIVTEIIINKDNKEMLFRTTSGITFDKEMKERRFIQILNETPVMFVKMPVKTFIEADFKGAYSADRRYDEFDLKTRYYLMGKDEVLHQITLNRKSLTKLYPDKKALIERAFRERLALNDEDLIISIIEKF